MHSVTPSSILQKKSRLPECVYGRKLFYLLPRSPETVVCICLVFFVPFLYGFDARESYLDAAVVASAAAAAAAALQLDYSKYFVFVEMKKVSSKIAIFHLFRLHYKFFTPVFFLMKLV